MKSARLLFANNTGRHTGSYLYDERVARGAAAFAWQVDLVALDGQFPKADARARESMDRALTTCPDHSPVVIDGLALADLADVLAPHRHRLYLIGLVHHPAAEEYGIPPEHAAYWRTRERAALGLMAQVIVTSEFTAGRLPDYGVDASIIHRVLPGVERAAISEPRWPARHLLCVATLIPRKGHRVLVDALAQLADLDWHCDMVGALDHDRHCVAVVQQAIKTQGLCQRIDLLGPRPPEALAALYRDCDLFVLPSFYEGYGMVVTEALAHGLPVVTTTGGALADTLPAAAGAAVAPGDSQAMANALRRLLTDRARYTSARAAAAAAREQLSDWTVTSEQFAAVLDLSAPSSEA